MPAASLPRSSSVPASSESGIRLIMPTKISMNSTMPVNLPSTIWVMLTGEDSSSAIVPLRRSSLISRMVSNGVTMSSMTLATSKVGITTRSVTPGAFGRVASCGCIVKKKSIWVKNDQAMISCVTASTLQASGERNMLRSSRSAMAAIMRLPRPRGSGRRKCAPAIARPARARAAPSRY